MAGVAAHDVSPETFSLLGGPLHRAALALRLVRGRTNTVWLGLVIGVSLWTLMTLLVIASGHADRFFSLANVGVHVRLLLVIPLFFVAETWLDPRLGAFAGMLMRSGMATEAVRRRLEAEFARLVRWKDSWVPDAACLALAVVTSLLSPWLGLPGATSNLPAGSDVSDLAPAARMHVLVCLPLFRFLLFRWCWRIGMWIFLLFRLSRLDLRLEPIHPDGAGGLGYLEVVHSQFLPLVTAHSALQAAFFAEEIVTGTMTFEAIYPYIVVVLAIDALIFLCPLVLFSPKLWASRNKGLRDYMELAEDYAHGFAGKWLAPGSSSREPLLGTPDLQSLADLNNSVDIVRNMRLVPASPRILRDYAVVALVPMVPLLLLKYPITEILQRVAVRLLGS